jgi:peptidyl-prolyl cis-trans isomerase A (cyclophilin A)
MHIWKTLGVALLASVSALAAPAFGQEQPPAKPDNPAPAPSQEAPAQEKLVHVLMKTSMGDIVLELNNEKAPISTQNFLNYVDNKYYDNTVFHRVIPGFMIQGGGFTPELEQKPTSKTIKNEWQNGLKNVKGSIAMARIGERPDSATSQFFINTVDNPVLDRPNDGAGYAVFGRVVSGMDVVQKIEQTPTTVRNRMKDVPATPVIIQSVRKLTPEEASKFTRQG